MLCLISFNELCRAMRNRDGEKNENLCLQRVSNSNPLGFRKIIQCPRLLGHRTKIYVWMCFKRLQYHRIRFIWTLVWQNIQRIYYGLICSCKVVNTVIYELHQAKRGLMVIQKKIVRYISAFDYYEIIYWFCTNTFENKMLQYFLETSESHVGYFPLWRHILRHLCHLLALCWKSHKPPFRLAQLIW